MTLVNNPFTAMRTASKIGRDAATVFYLRTERLIRGGRPGRDELQLILCEKAGAIAALIEAAQQVETYRRPAKSFEMSVEIGLGLVASNKARLSPRRGK